MINYLELPNIEVSYIPLPRRKKWNITDFKSPKSWNDNIQSYGIHGNTTLSIIDIDNKSKDQADNSLVQLSKLGLNTDTLIVKTKSGGYHLYYLAPEYEVRTCTNYFENIGIYNVDIRGHGGYVVGPDTSLTEWEPGKYVVIQNKDPVYYNLDNYPLPARNEQLSLVKNAEYYLDRQPIKEGERDNACLQIATLFAKRFYTDEQAMDTFTKIEFDPEFSVDIFMEKFTREREKITESADGGITLDILNERLVLMVEDSENVIVFDSYYKVTKTMSGLRGLYYQKFYPSPRAKGIYLVDAWLENPDRRVASGLRFVPKDVSIVIEHGKEYVNQFDISKLPVAYDRPVGKIELKSYFTVLENMFPDVEEQDLYTSQRAAKIQDLMWKPNWAFVLISEARGVGKGMLFSVFKKALGGLAVELSTSNIMDDKNEYLGNCLLALLNEPDGLQHTMFSKRLAESVKMFIGEREISIRKMYKALAHTVPVYYVPEIHSNVINAIHLPGNERRFCVIRILNNYLLDDDYIQLGKDMADAEWMSKWVRYHKDYKVSNLIKETRMPMTKWFEETSRLSRPDKFQDFDAAVEEGAILTRSDIHTNDSLMLLLMDHCGFKREDLAKKMIRELVSSGSIVKIAKGRKVPMINRNQDAVNENQRYYKSMTDNKYQPYMYAIRNQEKYKGVSGTILRNEFFFPWITV